jgi:Chromo (CHRromatin Organisation MOdifier) domain
VYDTHVRQRNAEIVSGDLVLVKTFADSGGLAPKLLSPTAGPYHVVARTEHSFKVRTAQRDVWVDVWVHSDRITKALVPEHLPNGVRYVSDSDETGDDSGQEMEDVDDITEFVVERLVSQEYRNGGDFYFKVRWFGYDPEDDTWELWDSLPEAKVMRYMRTKKMIPIP